MWPEGQAWREWIQVTRPPPARAACDPCSFRPPRREGTCQRRDGFVGPGSLQHRARRARTPALRRRQLPADPRTGFERRPVAHGARSPLSPALPAPRPPRSRPRALPGPSPALSTQPHPRGACSGHPDLHWGLGETPHPTEPPLEAGDRRPSRGQQDSSHSTSPRVTGPSHRRHQPLVNKPGAKSTKVRLGWGGGAGEASGLLTQWWDPDEATIGPFDLVSDRKTA